MSRKNNVMRKVKHSDFIDLEDKDKDKDKDIVKKVRRLDQPVEPYVDTVQVEESIVLAAEVSSQQLDEVVESAGLLDDAGVGLVVVDLTAEQEARLDAFKSVSDKIRYLHSVGMGRSAIAKRLGKLYQHVRNVLTTPLKRKVL